MDNCDIQLIGSPCGQHGPYTFYKAFKYTTKNGRKRIVTLSEFFFIKLWIDSDLLCIGELQLLWCDKNSEQVLASLRLYFLPENTPEGRLDHGEDEVLAISEKVVLRVEDLINWITVDAEWTWGRLAKCEKDVKEAPDHCTDDNNKSTIISTLTDSSLDFSDVEKERKTLDCNNAENEGPLVIILSYPRYCRYRAMMRRLEGVEDDYLKYKIVRALGGFTVLTKNTRVLFCKDTFDYPELEGHELLCNHLAPKLKGRPRGKRKKLRSMSPGSESNESEESTSIINIFPTISEKITTEGRNGLRCNSSSSSSVNNNDNTTSLRRSNRTIENSESKQFLKELTIFMKKNYTPIGKVPSLGYKEIDLYGFYIKVQKLGGYDSVTTNRLWKSIFDDMSGHQNSTSAATVIRRHYERFLLPYERYVKNEEHKPLPVSERRRLKSKNGNSSTSDDAETSEGTSRSGNSTPVPQTPNTPVENKEFNIQVKTESKTSSLRSIRVKSERQKEKQTEKTSSDKIDNNNDNVDDKKLESILIKPEKDVEPLTTAVAPVVQKLPPEKTPEPVEGKENVPTGGDVPNRKSPDIIEVPYNNNNNNNNNSNNNDNKQQTKSPEIIDLDDKTTILLNDMKKDKLDILKEGGLEVTPIRTFIPPSPPVKDIRPSVIQPTGVVVHQMPPPPPPPLLPQPPPPPLPPTTQQLPQALSVNQLTTNYRPQQKQQQQQKTKPNGFVTSTTTTPPKVLQSKSIFSSSTTTERTVYGDPREFNLTTINLSKFKSVPQQQQQPQPQQPVASQLPCDILDLSVTNLKKSAVEIMKLQPYQHYKNLQQQHQQQQQQQQQQQKQYNKPLYNHLLDGRRLGSNVEITLVNNNNNNNHNNNHNKSSIPNQSKFHNVASTPINHTNRPVHKRPSNEIYPHPKLPKLDDVKLNKSNNIIQPHSSRDHKYHDILYPNNNLMKVPLPPPPLPQQQQQQHHHHHHQQHHHPHQLPHNTKLPSSIPSYLAQLYDKSLPPTTPYLPFLDPFYYLYSHGNTTAVTTTTTSTTTTHHPPAPAPPPPPPPILPFPSQEQLKFYSDLMVRNSRLNFPFHINPNEHLSHFKKS